MTDQKPGKTILQARAPGGGRYELRALSAAGEAELLIYGEIGDDPFAEESIGARSVVAALAELPADYLTVRLNSYGGVVSDGLAIHNAIRRHPAAVTVEIDGVAFSIASLIAMAGDTVRIAENGLMMLHAPWGMAVGNARELREQAATMDKYAEAMATAYANKTARPIEEFVALLQDGADHYYTAQEAVDAGLADQISEEKLRLAATDRRRLLEVYRQHMPAAALAALGTSSASADTPRTTNTTTPAQESNTMTTDASRESGSGGAAPTDSNVITINAAREEAIRAERERTTEIRAIARLYPAIAEDAEAACASGTSLDEFRAQVIPKLSNARPLASDAGHVDMSRSDRGRYSLVRACRAQLTGNWKDAGFEREVSIAIASQAKRDPKGVFVPYNVGWGSALRAATMTKQADDTGGYLVQTDPGDFIDNLRAISMVFQLGARRIGDLVGDVSFPKKTGSAAFTWIDEDDDSAETNLTTGSVLMAPKTASGSVPISRKLLLQSSPDVEMMVRDDLLLGAALAVDAAALNGSGIGATPIGILNTTGVNTTSVSSAGDPTWAETVDFESAVATDNALAGTIAYLTTPTVRGNMKVRAKDSGSGQFVWTDTGTVNGYRAEASTQMPTSKIIFGNWAELMIGFWGVIDVRVDEATKAASGGLVLRAFVDADVAVRHPTSFCVPA